MRNTIGGLRAWFHRHPLIPDLLLGATLAAAAVPFAHVAQVFGDPARLGEPDAMSLGLIVTGCLSVALRRHWPFLLLCLVCLTEITLAAAGRSSSLLWLAALVLVYTIAVRRGLALSLCAPALALTGHFLATAVGGGLGGWSTHLPMVVFAVSLWIAGRNVRLRRAYQAELHDRARRMERIREADTRAARAEERSRIARELHDVVAHHVSVMTVQAAAARRVLAGNPEGAREALSAIEELGRTAMSEMRSLVGVLRTDAMPAERNPQPGMREIPALVDQMREAGLRTQLWIEDERGTAGAAALPPGVDLAAYRLVQEALTNSLRHAGPQARAWVTVRHESGELAVKVTDDGLGQGACEAGEGETGHGLVGIRERVALYGGLLRIGPRPEGGFEVDARFPLKDT
ncbi:sensor histidine kinase [Streptosporangium sp. NBC_01810]|uniref:sensor histidine kinase n=1 Tax=Streptosporangium sp. NBC_01810 TaxID=2975951 RepID=UPI002DDA9E53|nr:sensor histidine kinase [Streptosporangium sp. NBC_01810]WSA29094.1 sensor histidine kinase [Streptosporangium sp. NBC_01810]